MISVLLPTLRPHLLEAVVRSIAASAKRCTQLVELIMITDLEDDQQVDIDGFDKAIVVHRERHGVIDATNEGFRRSRGDFIFVTNDQTLLDERCLAELSLKSEVGRFKIVGPHHLPEFNFEYYGLPFQPFGFVDRITLATLYRRDDVFFDPTYKAFYADPDQSMKAHQLGIPVTTIETAIIHHKNEGDAVTASAVSKYLEADRATFRARWDHLGEFRDP